MSKHGTIYIIILYNSQEELSSVEHVCADNTCFHRLSHIYRLQVFEVLDRPTGKVLSTINFQLRSRKHAGFMLSRDWLKLLDVKVGFSLC